MSEVNKSKSILKGMGIYAIGTFGTKFLSFLIVPIYTYYIATEEMGIYDVLVSTISLLIPVVTLQISDAAYRWIIRDEEVNKDRYIVASIQALTINVIVAMLIVFAVNRIHLIPYCVYFALSLMLSSEFQTIQKIVRGLKNQWLFAVSGIIYTGVYLILNVLQLCVLRLGVESLFLSTIIASIISILSIFIFEPKIRVNCFQKPDIRLIMKMYKFSIPLVPNNLNWWVINSSDRYIVLSALGASSNGLLAIAHKFPSILQSVLNLFTSSWQDVSIADNTHDSATYYTSLFRVYSLISLSLLWVAIPITKLLIVFIMSDAYKASSDYVAFYYLGTVFQGFSSFYGVGYLKSNKTGKAFSTSVYGAIVNALVNILLIRFIGLQAAAISTFFGFLIMWLLREKENRKELGIRVKWSEIFLLTSSSIFVSLISIIGGVKVNLALTFIGVVAASVVNKDLIFKTISTLREKIKK